MLGTKLNNKRRSTLTTEPENERANDKNKASFADYVKVTIIVVGLMLIFVVAW